MSIEANPANRLRLASGRHAPDCEFCDELVSPASSTYGRLYKNSEPTRTLIKTSSFTVWPTLGQFVQGGLLVVTNEHHEMMSKLSPSNLVELMDLIRRIRDLSPGKKFAIYEHGATAKSGASCGIYHAHIHLTPLEKIPSAEEVLGPNMEAVQDMSVALERLTLSSQYLLYADSSIAGYIELSSGSVQYQSQYLRRRVKELSGSTHDWNWRNYQQPEVAVMETLREYRAKNASK